MKTIIDAVNYLKGDLANCSQWSSGDVIVHQKHDTLLSSAGRFTRVSDDFDRNYYVRVCTTEEFNQCVEEMSEGFEEYKREYEMDKVETVTVDGMVYELGKSYITAAKEIAILVCAASPEEFRVKYPAGDCGTFISTRLAVNPEWTTGTITPAPVELVDGNAYQFDYISDVGGEVIVIDECAIGKYINGVLCGTREYNPDYCKNIIPLVPEVK